MPTTISRRKASTATIMLVALCGLGGCVTVPAESVVVQDRVVDGIAKARRREVAYIDKTAQLQKELKRANYQRVLPDVLAKKYPGKTSYTADELAAVLKEYDSDLASEFGAIDTKADEARKQHDEFYNDLAHLATANRDFMASAVKTQELLKAQAAKLGAAVDKTTTQP